MTEDLREAKQFEHKLKASEAMRKGLEQENRKLIDKMGIKIV